MNMLGESARESGSRLPLGGAGLLALRTLGELFGVDPSRKPKCT